MVIIDKKYKFAFIHVYKNAGTSITSNLLKLYLPLSTRKAFENLENLTRANKTANKLVQRLEFKIGSKRLKKINPYSELETHSLARDVKLLMGDDEYNQLTSFAVCRNPYDWQVSLYKYAAQTKNHPEHETHKNFKDFNEYIDWRCAQKDVRLQKDFFTDDTGKTIINRRLRFENIAEEFEALKENLGIPIPSLKHINKSRREGFEEYYSDESKRKIREIYAEDFEYFKYNK